MKAVLGTVGLTFVFGISPASSQQITGTPGSPNTTTTGFPSDLPAELTS
ncbi:hypothetical protein [Hyphomicrobium sp. MC8b]